MAITRLTDIVDAMKSKWTYGDKDFAYEFEVNQHHNTQYPYLMIIPPDSQLPEVYNGWESYNFEIDFFDLYQTKSQQTVKLEQKWDNLEDLSLEWLNNVMIKFNNPTGSNVGVYFLEESIDIERVKEVANDRLIQIKMKFTMRGVTRCMFGSIPTHNPSQIPNLAMWYSADSYINFSIPTKQVNYWGDKSGNGTNLYQDNSTYQPKRYTYPSSESLGIFNNKTRIYFPIKPKYLSTNNYGLTGLSSGSFTIFVLYNARYINSDIVMRSAFTSESNGTHGKINIGSAGTDWHRATVSDGTATISANNGFGNSSQALFCYKLKGDTLTPYINGVKGTPVTTVGFDATNKFSLGKIHLGADPTAAAIGNPPEIPNFEGSLVEIIAYDSALNDFDRGAVDKYINDKYKIY
jgi:hypothetical protein